MANQSDTVLRQLRGGPITSLQMIQSFGITRLATVIFALREDGFNITTEMVNVLNRWGKECTVARYALKRGRRRNSPRLARLLGARRGRPAPKARKPAPPSKRARAKGRA